MTDAEMFITPDPQLVVTRRVTLNEEASHYFNFPSVEIPGLEHIRKSLAYGSTALARTGYSKLPAYELFSSMCYRPANLRMEGRRFIDMLYQPIYGGTTKMLYLARALVEEFQAVEFEAGVDNASRVESITVRNVLSVVSKYERIISDFYLQVPMFLQNLLDYVTAQAENIQNLRQARMLLQAYVQSNIEDAGREIVQRIVDMIEPGDQLLIIACSHLLLSALITAAHKFRATHQEFSIILTQANDPTARQKLQATGLNVTVYLPNHLPYLLSGVTKAFAGCFEVSANGDILARAGALQLAILLRNRKIPLYFSAETFKFSNRIITNQFHGNAAHAADTVEFIFDVVGHKLVTGIICQLGCFSSDSLRVLPCCYGRPNAEIVSTMAQLNTSLSRNQTMQSNEESASGSARE